MTAVRTPILALALAAALAVSLAMFTNVLPFRQIVAQRQEIDAAQARLDDLVASNRALESQVDALHTPLEVERLAREQLGYVRPGERAYVVIEPEPAPRLYAEDFEEPPPAAPEVGRPWFARLWDWVTGRDLVR